jgi:phage-related protein
LYVARFAEAVYVLHAFEKRTRKTPRRDLSLARQRFHELLALRRARKTSGG